MIKDVRHLMLIKNISGIFVAKILGLTASFLLMPILIRYLDPEAFGIWIAISSIIGWFAFFDLGLSNGLRNSLGFALASNNNLLARRLVSTTLGILIAIACFLVLVFAITNHLIEWSNVFNSSADKNYELGIALVIILFVFVSKFILSITLTVLAVYHRSAVVEYTNASISVIFISLVYLLSLTSSNSLAQLALMFAVSNICVLTLLTWWTFRLRYNEVIPSFKFFDLNLIKSLTGHGVRFFIIQVAAMLIFTTDNFIILHLFSPEAIAPYNLAYKLFSIIMIGFGILVTPMWAVLNEAYVNDDINWIKKATANLLKAWLITSTGSVILLTLSAKIYEIWVGNAVVVPLELSVLMCIYVVIHTFISIFATFIFATGHIKIQMYLAVLAALLNIPLSVLLAKQFAFGTVGVIMATIICISPNLIAAPIQYLQIIRRKTQGKII